MARGTAGLAWHTDLAPIGHFLRGYPCRLLATFPRGLIGQSASALPSGSVVNLFGDGKSVINLDAEISDCALDLCVTEQQLDSP